MDLTPVAHCSAIKEKFRSSNFFDGFRTSHEIQKIETWDYEDLKDMVDMDAVDAFVNMHEPEPSVPEGSAQNRISSSRQEKPATPTMMLCRKSFRCTWTK